TQDECLEEPRRMREVPLGRADVLHRLYDVVLRRERLAEPLREPPHSRILPQRCVRGSRVTHSGHPDLSRCFTPSLTRGTPVALVPAPDQTRISHERWTSVVRKSRSRSERSAATSRTTFRGRHASE